MGMDAGNSMNSLRRWGSSLGTWSTAVFSWLYYLLLPPCFLNFSEDFSCRGILDPCTSGVLMARWRSRDSGAFIQSMLPATQKLCNYSICYPDIPLPYGISFPFNVGRSYCVSELGGNILVWGITSFHLLHLCFFFFTHLTLLNIYHHLLPERFQLLVWRQSVFFFGSLLYQST